MHAPIQPPASDGSLPFVTDDIPADYLPARMINESVYCPRLFYLEHVEGQFAHNCDTEQGSQIHSRVDGKVDALESPESDPQSSEDAKPDATADSETPKTIHARSVTLSSKSLMVVAKLDLIEGSGKKVTPVEYKRGSPKRGQDEQLTAWDPERVQVCLQGLILRENGFECDSGVIYFAETRQRVTILFDDQLVELTRKSVANAHALAEQESPPPPLVKSPKCPRCSLVGICLPDETNRCRTNPSSGVSGVRLPSTPRDDLRPLYLNTQGLFVGKSGEVLQVKDKGKLIQEVRINELNQVNVFGNIQVSTQALNELTAHEIPVVFHSQRGYLHGILHGTGLKNIVLRREQFRMADDADRSLKLAKELVVGKIRNQRTLLMRNHVSPPESAIRELKRFASLVDRVDSSQSLLGIEGTAARIYFEHFSGMLKPGDQPMDPNNSLGEAPRWAFDFRGRNRRPPKDAVNAMLGLGYSLLTKDFTVACQAVGLDPYMGFYHVPRPGRPALPLDLMEPFRPLIVDSTVITAVNTRMMCPEHFVNAGEGVTCTDSGRRAFFRAYEQRMDTLVTHPLFDYRVSYRRLLEIQTRLLGRFITGEIDFYPVFTTR
jgi:CRISP-associated protein Cas1